VGAWGALLKKSRKAMGAMPGNIGLGTLNRPDAIIKRIDAPPQSQWFWLLERAMRIVHRTTTPIEK
jgi:hypothetical protein